MGLRKPDFAPLLAPGRHFMNLEELWNLTVVPFDPSSRSHREKLFYGYEELVQALLIEQIPCQVWTDGSFLTEKPYPGDIDAIVIINSELSTILNNSQNDLIFRINTTDDFFGVDNTAFFNYPRHHELFGRGLDGLAAAEGFGIENSERYVKGYVIMRIMETNVGLRVCC